MEIDDACIKIYVQVYILFLEPLLLEFVVINVAQTYAFTINGFSLFIEYRMHSDMNIIFRFLCFDEGTTVTQP